MCSQFDDLLDEECIEYAANCLAEGISIPEPVVIRLRELGVYDLIMDSVGG